MDQMTRMQAFVEVVDAGGFSAAARRLGRSKALMSRYVRDLEDGLGTLLIARTPRQFSLTPAGRLYHERATELLRQLVDLEDSVRESGVALTGRLRIAAPRSLIDHDGGMALVRFAAAHPDLLLDVHLDDRLVDLVEDGFDVALRISRLVSSGLIARKLADFRLAVCAAPSLLAAQGEPDEPRGLARLPAVVDTNWSGRANWLFTDAAGNDYPVAMNAVMEVNSPELARKAALDGLGVTMVPRFVVAADIAAGRLRELFPQAVTGGSGIYAVYPHRRHVPARTRAFVDHLAAWFRDQARS